MLMHCKSLSDAFFGNFERMSSKGFAGKNFFIFFQISLGINPNWKKSLKCTHKEAYFY